MSALNELLGDREGYQRQLQQNIAAVIHTSATSSTDAINEKLLALQQELLKKGPQQGGLTSYNKPRKHDTLLKHYYYSLFS